MHDVSIGRNSSPSASLVIMAAISSVNQPLIKLLNHLLLACVLVLMSFSPLKTGIPGSSSMQIVSTVTVVTLALETAYATSVGDSQHSTVANVAAGRQYDLRLVGSNVTSEGLLQVFMDGRWGWVYRYSDVYQSMVAEVACRQLGYMDHSTELFSFNESIKLGPTPWLMARVKCSGYESRLVDCGHINHTSALSEGEEKVHVALKCVDALSEFNDSVQVFLNGSRLAGFLQIKKAPYEGWLPFCGYIRTFPWSRNTYGREYPIRDIEVAHVICRQLGHTHAWSITPVGNGEPITQGTSQVVKSIACQGFESLLSQCTITLQPSCPQKRVDIALLCKDSISLPLGSEVRLDPLNRVQVRYYGVWHYLPSDGYAVSDAVVVCRQFGSFNLSRSWIKVDLDLRTLLPFTFMCRGGNETSLMECIPHKIPPGNGRFGILHVECTQDTTPDLGSLRLVSGGAPNKGRIEIYGNDSQWGTICDDFWTNDAATVACRQMGLGRIGISRGSAYYGSGNGPILLDDVQCKGYEERLLECDTSALGEHNCVHSEDAGVECYDQMPTVAPNKEWKVTLVGGPGPDSGTIQLQIDDQNGTICDDHFGLNDGLVVCKMLGYPFVAAVHPSARHGVGQGDILLDDLKCTGRETSLEDCWFAPIGTHNCQHSEDAGVTCSHDYVYGGPTWTETPLVSIPTNNNLSPNGLNLGIGSATILITLLVVMCVGCMFCACIMRRLRVNSNIDNINNNRDNSYAMVNQRDSTPASANSVPPSYTDVLSNPNDYSQVNDANNSTIPPQSPPPNSPPPSYARTFQVGNNTLRVITVTDPASEGEQRVRREPIPIPLSPPPSYDDAAPVFPLPEENRSGQALPDVVTVTTEADERSALRETPEDSENTTVI